MTRRLLPLMALALWGCGVTDPAALQNLPPPVLPALAPEVPALRVIAMGDSGTGSSSQQLVADAMATRARERGVDFVLTTGDNFYSDGVESVDDEQWETKYGEIYADPALNVPWHVSLGNHDHKGSVEAQIAYRDGRWSLPARYYTFVETLEDGTTVEFFVIDTTPILDEPEQIAWLEQALTDSEADWRVVVGHHPFWSSCSRPFRGANGPMIEALWPLFVEHEVDIVLTGHDHILELRKPEQGVYHAITGAGGGPAKAYGANWNEVESHYVATGGGFMYLTFTADALYLEFVRNAGETQFAHVLHQREAKSE